MTKRQHARGFTLVEILVVIGILVTLAALLLPTARTMLNKGKDTKCLSNLRQWCIALNCYLSDSTGELPYEGAEENPTWAQTGSAANEKTWYNVLPPYVEQIALKNLNAVQRNEFYLPSKSRILQCPRAVWVG